MALPAEDFWMNARIHAATQAYKEDARNTSETDRQVEDLQEDADDRADFADEVGSGQIDPAAQRAALEGMEQQARGVNR